MNKSLFWRRAVSGENWLQTLFRMLGNLIQWAVAVTILGLILSLIILSIPTRQERYASGVIVELEFINRPENPSWKFEKVGGSNFTYNEFIPTFVDKGLSSPIRSPQSDRDCNLVSPLLVSLHNTNPGAVEKVNFTLTAKRPARSTNVLPSSNAYRSLDFILEPGETVRRCLPISPDVTNDLIWEANITSVIIR